MDSSKKKCHSIFTKDFTDSLSKADATVAKAIIKKIEMLEGYENNPETIPDGIKSPELACGKMLSELNRNIYSLEPKLKIRALAHVTQKDGVKVYVWLWGGTHEKYNKMLDAQKLAQEERASNLKNGAEIKSQITEMSVNLSKPKVSANIQQIRENIKGNKHGKYKGPGH